jgi:hypothetical protein
MTASARTEDRIATTPPFLIRSARRNALSLTHFHEAKRQREGKSMQERTGQKAECSFAASANSDNYTLTSLSLPNKFA